MKRKWNWTFYDLKSDPDPLFPEVVAWIRIHVNFNWNTDKLLTSISHVAETPTLIIGVIIYLLYLFICNVNDFYTFPSRKMV